MSLVEMSLIGVEGWGRNFSEPFFSGFCIWTSSMPSMKATGRKTDHCVVVPASVSAMYFSMSALAQKCSTFGESLG